MNRSSEICLIVTSLVQLVFFVQATNFLKQKEVNLQVCSEITTSLLLLGFVLLGLFAEKKDVSAGNCGKYTLNVEEIVLFFKLVLASVLMTILDNLRLGGAFSVANYEQLCSSLKLACITLN